MVYINLKSPYQIYREDIRLLIEKKMNIWKRKPIHTLSLLSSQHRDVRTKIKWSAPDFIFPFQENNGVANAPTLIDFLAQLNMCENNKKFMQVKIAKAIIGGERG